MAKSGNSTVHHTYTDTTAYDKGYDANHSMYCVVTGADSNNKISITGVANVSPRFDKLEGGNQTGSSTSISVSYSRFQANFLEQTSTTYTEADVTHTKYNNYYKVLLSSKVDDPSYSSSITVYR